MPIRRLLLLALTAVAALGVTVVAAIGFGQAQSGVAAFAPLSRPPWARPPGLSLQVLDGGPGAGRAARVGTRAARDGRVQLGELRGIPLVVNFWASWCTPCRQEAPLLEHASQRAGGTVLIIGVNQNDTPGPARRFLRELKVTYPTLTESGDATSVRWAVRGFPVSYFITAGGRAIARYVGQLRAPQLRRGITAASTGTYTR